MVLIIVVVEGFLSYQADNVCILIRISFCLPKGANGITYNHLYRGILEGTLLRTLASRQM